MLKQQVATRFLLIKIVTSSNFWRLRMNRINYYPKRLAERYNNKHFENGDRFSDRYAREKAQDFEDV